MFIFSLYQVICGVVMGLRHGGRSFLVWFFFCFFSSYAAAAASSIVRDRSQARIKIDHLQRGDEWYLKGSRGQICFKQTADADGNVEASIAKLASNEGVELWVKRGQGDIAKLTESKGVKKLSPLAKVSQNAILYQIPVRTYAAKNLGQNQTGQFADINAEVLAHLKRLNVDYIWVTGALEQASRGTTDADVVKGDAGSYYALRDMWDAAPELGGLRGLEDLIERAHAVGLRVLLDLVPNHTSRLHDTDIVCKRDLNFGQSDDTANAFDVENNYYYLQGTTFIPPRQSDVEVADGVFDRDIHADGVQHESPAKVTGNDVTSSRPSIDDWFETVKLNYGFNIFNGERLVNRPTKTWFQILDVASYWVEKGVDGFRIDFAHVVPLEFWRWFSAEIRKVNPATFLVAEAYESGKSARTFAFSYERLLAAGIDTVFQSEMYWRLHDQARDESDIRRANPLRLPPLRTENVTEGRQFTYYLENHDEIRLASRTFAENLPDRLERAELGFAFTAYVALLPGHALIHGGQEFAEDASVYGSFAGRNGKTSIFDFVFQAFTRAWWQGDRSDAAQRSVTRYEALAEIKKRSVFASSHRADHLSYYDLEPVNWPKSESHWVASYLRINPDSKDTYLVVLNSHPTDEVETTLHFTTRRGDDSFGILSAMGVKNEAHAGYRFVEQLRRPGWVPRDPALQGNVLPGSVLFYNDSVPSGLYLGRLAPRSTYVFKLERM